MPAGGRFSRKKLLNWLWALVRSASPVGLRSQFSWLAFPAGAPAVSVFRELGFGVRGAEAGPGRAVAPKAALVLLRTPSGSGCPSRPLS